MEIVPNLHFNGNCENAIALYEKAFQARRTVFLRYKDANPLDFQNPENDATRDYVYHAEMLIGGQRVFLNDNLDEKPSGINVSVLISFDSVAEVKVAYAVLKEGAEILAPMKETTYSGCFVSLIDCYGVRWELMKEN